MAADSSSHLHAFTEHMSVWSHHNKLLTSLLKYHVYTMDTRIVLADLFLMCGGRGVFPWSVAGFIHPKTRNPSLLFTSSVSLHDGRTHWHSTAAAHRGAQSNTQGLLLSIHNHSLPTKHSRGISYLISFGPTPYPQVGKSPQVPPVGCSGTGASLGWPG